MSRTIVLRDLDGPTVVHDLDQLASAFDDIVKLLQVQNEQLAIIRQRLSCMEQYLMASPREQQRMATEIQHQQHRGWW